MPAPDFTLQAYADLLRAAIDSGYRFRRFSERNDEGSSPVCLLRHDIDAELLGCASMLDVEKRAGVTATYFLMIRSTAYNLFCPEAREAVARILQDGHEIGLHFMGEGFKSADRARLISEVLRESQLLEHEFGTKVSAVSFHQPSSWILSAELQIDNLTNTYSRGQMGNFFYVSDTNMQWKQQHPMEIFRRRLHSKLQLLVHPIWWTQGAMALVDKWANVLGRNSRAVVDHWLARERSLAGLSADDVLFRDTTPRDRQ